MYRDDECDKNQMASTDKKTTAVMTTSVTNTINAELIRPNGNHWAVMKSIMKMTMTEKLHKTSDDTYNAKTMTIKSLEGINKIEE